MMPVCKPIKGLTQTILKTLLVFDEEIGQFSWIVPPKQKHMQNPDGFAGTINKEGYRSIHVFGRYVRVQNLVWLYITGEWPMKIVDHKNKNKLDNRPSNLRLATHIESAANRNVFSNNSSGYPGVVWIKSAKKWQASISYNKKRIYLGIFATKEEASQKYQEARKELFGEFA